ncbi:S-adenosyl-L-methionine-dependent methyltransferase [Xylariaceae sp. FL0594]|nr:S-adenosyl-L-methionine-dependent methyltransferase [Xylariaceae sp. FL0594]
MSLYHETADVLSASPSGGNLKTRIFSNVKKLKSPPQTVYALASETCKWSSVLKEVVDNSELLRHERKLTPVLALLLVHDFLLAKKGIALPASHGLRIAIERHKARLTSELTRARLRRKVGSIDALRQLVAVESLVEAGAHPRWVRVNTIKTTLREQLDTTFKDFEQVTNLDDVIRSTTGKAYYVDEHIPNLLGLSPLFEITKTRAYASGAVIIQDKASCFPAYLLDPGPEDGDVIDSCAAPGNKTTHVASLVMLQSSVGEPRKVYAFEKDPYRAKTLEKMVKLAGADAVTTLNPGQDFLKVDPKSPLYKDVGALLLDPSCSGSGIVGRDAMPTIHLPESGTQTSADTKTPNRKRKRETNATTNGDDEGGGNKKKKKENEKEEILVDDDGKELVVNSPKELHERLEALSQFQLTLLLHALSFPSARRVTYSTCSVHGEENEGVVLRVLASEVARKRGWRVLRREEQVNGMREWPVRGDEKLVVDHANPHSLWKVNFEEVAEACIRSYKDDGRGVMGFFVAAFVRDPSAASAEEEKEEARAETGDHETTVKVGSIAGNKRGKKKGKRKEKQETIQEEERKVEVVEDGADDSWDGFDD